MMQCGEGVWKIHARERQAREAQRDRERGWIGTLVFASMGLLKPHVLVPSESQSGVMAPFMGTSIGKTNHRFCVQEGVSDGLSRCCGSDVSRETSAWS